MSEPFRFPIVSMYPFARKYRSLSRLCGMEVVMAIRDCAEFVRCRFEGVMVDLDRARRHCEHMLLSPSSLLTRDCRRIISVFLESSPE